MRKPHLKAGFTLIELLFIVIIFGIFMALITSAFQQRAINYKINKTAIQMEQILQAAIAYNNDYGRWPTSTNPPADFLAYYLPAGSNTNPWGQPYTYTLDQNGNLQINSGRLANPAIALQVYSLLPNAALMLNYVLLPAPNLQQNFPIKGIGTFPDSPKKNNETGTIPTPFTCPAGTSLLIAHIPSIIQPSTFPLHDFVTVCPAGAAPIGTLTASITSCTPGVSCAYKVYFVAEIPDSTAFLPCTSSVTYSEGKTNFTYIAYCG